MKSWIVLGFTMLFMLSACKPSEAEMQATVTQVAAELYGTQTALAPTVTPTFTPTITPTHTDTPTPTHTPTTTNTPRPPTATLTAAGVEKLMLCYKAAVSIQADWEVHRLVTDTWDDGQYRTNEEISQALNAFLRERTYRAGAIKILDKLDLPLGNDTLVVDGVVIQKGLVGGTVCDPHFGTIIASAGGLSQGPWGVGSSSRISHSRSIIRSAVRIMRKALLEVYEVDPSELEAIEDPIWQFVHDRYDVEIP